MGDLSVLSDDQLTTLKDFARAPVIPLPSCTDAEFAAYLRIMDSSLKQRDTDYSTGKLRQRTYYARLGSRWPADAVKHMTQICIDTMIFFPSVSECLTIIKTWEHPGRRVREVASAMLRSEDDRRYRDAAARLQRGEVEQGEVEHWPLSWKRRLEHYFWGLRVVDGQHVLRPGTEPPKSE